MLRGGDLESAEKQWGKFRDIVMEHTNIVCGVRHRWAEKKEEV